MASADNNDFDSFNWAQKFCIECDVELMPDKESYVERFVKTGNMYYFVADGQVVSMAANHRNTETAKAIGYVYTPPHLRGNGYAHALVSMLSEKLLETTDSVILYADAANPISNHIYKKIGYKTYW